MRVSFNREIDGGRILCTLGKVQAASPWHATNGKREGSWENAALRALIATAEDIEADAIIDVGYTVDGTRDADLADVRLERVTASGIAVRLASN